LSARYVNTRSPGPTPSWFVQQHLHDLYCYFAPYLDYGSAGVDLNAITMKPPDLPEAPLVRRPLKNAKKG
jgi:hypothetical protein